MESLVRKSFSLAGLAAASLAAGFLMALGSLGANPNTADLYLAAQGLHATNPEGKSPTEQLAAAAWEQGGPQALSLVRWGVNWLAWSLGFLGLFLASGWLGRCLGGRWRKAIGWAVALLVAGSALLTAVMAGLGWQDARRNFRLVAPVDLVAALPVGESVYANPSAQHFVVLLGARRNLTPAAPDAPSWDPTAWRKAIRQELVKRVLLVGPVAEFRPLLDHLLTSADWKIEKISHHGWIFTRGAAHDSSLPDLEAVDLGDAVDTALSLAYLGRRLDAMGATFAARDAMERSMELAPSEPGVLLSAAAFHADRNHWHEVVSLTSRALREGGNPSYALNLQAHALFESGRQGQAREAIERSLAADPKNLNSLFLASKIFRASNDFAKEAETLERLVKVSGADGSPTGGYLAYLGQSYARVGNARAAIQAYRRALSSGDLNAEQQAAVEEALALIESRSSGAFQKKPRATTARSVLRLVVSDKKKAAVACRLFSFG